MYSSSDSTGGGSNFPRSMSQCSEMKSSDVTITSSASVNSVKTTSVEHSLNSSMSQFNTVPVLNQNNAEAHQAKQVTDNSTSFTQQSEVYFESKFSKSQTYDRKKSSKKIEKTKLTNSKKHKKQQELDKIKKSKVIYEHQSLVEHLYPSSIIDQAKTTLINMKMDGNVSLLLEVLEILGALSISLPMCTTPTQVASQLVLSIRAMTKGSITESIFNCSQTIEWCKDIFGYNIFEPQSGLGDGASWLSSLPNLQENWDAVRGAPVFEKISNVISLAASIGLCSVTNLSWSVKGIEIFRAGNMRKHASAMDLFGAVLDTVVLFIEGGYECFKEGSFRPLLFSSDEGRKFDSMYFTLIELHEHAMVFNLHTKPIEYNGETRPITDLEYGSMVDEAIELATSAYKSAKGTWQQGILEKRLTVLRQNRAAYAAKRIDGSMRYAPYSVYIWGESSVGKSTIAQVLMSDCLSAAGANPSSKNTAILKETDKFDSSLKGDTEGIFLDDMGNTKKDFLDKSPTERLIDINNNMITYANKADLHEKGKIEIRPRVLVVTSNAYLSTHATLGSIHPFSIVRRCDLHIEVIVKPEFATIDGRLDSKKVMSTFQGESLVNDVWDLNCHFPCHKDKGGDNHHLISATGNGHKPTPLSINDTLRIATTKCIEHFKIQRLIVEKGEGLVASRNYCTECRLCSDLCECAVKQSRISETFEHLQSQMIQVPSYLMGTISCVPEKIVTNSFVQKCYMFYHGRNFIDLERSTRRDLSLIYLSICALLFVTCNLQFVYCLAFFVICLSLYLSILAKWRSDMCSKLASTQFASGALFESIRKSKAIQFFSLCILGKMIHSLVLLMKTSHMLRQTALAPADMSELEKRNDNVNPWATAVMSKLHINDKSATMTHDQVVAKVKKNLFHAKFVENGFMQSCDILALGGNIFLMPLHVFENRKDMKILVTKDDPSLLSSTFRGFASVETMIPITGKDLCIVCIPSAGVLSDIIHLFPTDCTVTGTGRMLYRNDDGSMRDDLIRITSVKDSKSGGPGYKYNCAYDTFTGLCMSVIVGRFAKSCIAGLHLRGVSGTPQGLALTVTEKELRVAIESAHNTWTAIFPSHVNGTFPVERYEKQVISDTKIHPKSPLNFLPIGSNVEFIGCNNARVDSAHSEVITTPISATVAAVTGITNQFGPPKFHRWKMWQTSLQHSANPSAGVEPSLVSRAVVDYTGHLVEIFNSEQFDDMSTKELRPLSDMETICGRDNCRFIDAMNRGTSKGFPLTGSKGELITLLDPIDYPEHQCPAECDQMIIDEVESMQNELLNGRRCYSIFKACVKDEPTKIGKDKVRVFQAADFATQIMVRKYYLPVARMLSLFPLTSECAVGINAQGPEWDQLARHMKKFGDERIFAGDYSKYDLRMPADLITAAFKCMLIIAEECGDYTMEDKIIMKGIATEIAYSCVSYNGDMIIHCGSNPSGQNLTVYINCIVNSLLMRSAYYHMYPAMNGNPEPFRHNVAVSVYGDDVKGSVRKGCDWFNHMSYADFLKERDMVFTMPDKTSDPTPYMTDEDADFLKRHNLYCEETKLIHGVLDENSIFKSLHSVLKSKSVSPLDQSAMNIDGALREWWQYGREMYEKRREQMKDVALQTNISHMCTELDVTYDDRMEMFNKRYDL